MVTKNLALFKLIVATQLIVIYCVIFYIYQKRIQTHISPIQKNGMDIRSTGNIKYFWEPKPSITIQKNNDFPPEFTSKFKITINQDSLNERRDYSVSKPKNVFRIITLGDSLTYGLYVDTKDNWTELLEDKLNSQFNCKKYQKIEVINLGVYAYDPQYEVERYKTRGKKYDPDLVIWFLIENDFNEINELMLPKVNTYTLEAINRGGYQNNLKDLGIYYGPAWSKAKSEITQELGIQGILNYNTRMIYSLNDYFKKRLLVMSPSQISPEYGATIQKFVKDRQNTYYFNNLSYISDKNAVFPDYHPNQLGHKLISQDLFDYIKDKKLIQCD